MNRTEKKCIIASAGIHLLLVLVLLVGPAFLSRQAIPEDFQLITIEPDILSDKPGKGGGELVSQPTPRQAQPPSTPPAPEPKKPEPVVVEPVKARPTPVQQKQTPEPEEKLDPDAFEKTTKPKAKKIEVNTQLVTRRTTSDSKTSRNTSAETTAERNRKLEQISKNIGSLKSSLAPGAAINVRPGFGGGGASYANYRDYVGSVYFSAWIPPERTARESAIVRARVTIARDGTVLSARIMESSGDPLTDASVQRTLERVKNIRPFPAESSDQERTYPLLFDLSAKRLEG